VNNCGNSGWSVASTCVSRCVPGVTDSGLCGSSGKGKEGGYD
jgi:hypothetical protein